MALTGDLAQLHIADIIQLIHTTRKSGTLTVKGSRGESRIIFSNGYLVGASHLSNRVRIGTVLVKMNAISVETLKQAIALQKKAGRDRKPLLSTLKKLGQLDDNAAFRGLKKLIEITIVELISWNGGTFTFDDTAIAVAPDCNYSPADMEQEMSLDAQMVLMDALRVFDERERDKQAGQEVQPYEEFFADVLPPDDAGGPETGMMITADVLGLADLEQLENRIPAPVSVPEIFDPVEIHRQIIRQILSAVPADEQEAFVSFLKKATSHISSIGGQGQHEGPGSAVIIFTTDELLTHATMTICKNEGILVFATDREEELDRIVEQCQAMKVMPALIFDTPGSSGSGLRKEDMAALRLRQKGRHPRVPAIQFADPRDFAFMLQSFRDGIRAVFPKPARESSGETFIADMISFLEAFRSFARGMRHDAPVFAEAAAMRKLKERIAVLRHGDTLSEISHAMLQYVSQEFDRTITFVVHAAELTGDEALGVNAEKNEAPTPAAALKIPLSVYSVFRDMIEGGQLFFGEGDDDVLREHLFAEIGAPLRRTILLLPLKGLGQVRAVVYGDFGKREVSPVPVEMLEILAQQASLALENAMYRAQILRTSQKP
jgi:hypothetical protein